MSTFSPTLAPTSLLTDDGQGIDNVHHAVEVAAVIFVTSALFIIVATCLSPHIRIFLRKESEDRALVILNTADSIGNILLNDEHLNRIGEFEFGDDSKPHSANDNEPTKCSICLREFKTGEACRTMPAPCQHTFHKFCIDNWFHLSSRCPMCKRSIFNILDEESQSPEHTNEIHPYEEMMMRL